MARKIWTIGLLGVLLIALIPTSAGAAVDGECDGSATIKGVTYTPANDTPGNAIPIPDEDGVQVTYSGSVGFENKQHSGSAKVQVGPFNITLGEEWGGSNEADTRSVTNQVYRLDDFRDKLPIWIPGVWKVTATHSASGGECSGYAMVKLAGSPLGNVVGWVVVVGLLGTAALGVMSLIGGKTAGAAIAGLLFGLFLGLALMMWSVRPLDTLTTVVVPLVLAVGAGVAAGMLGPKHG